MGWCIRWGRVQVYHLSSIWLGSHPQLMPQVPRDMLIGEPDIPRICVAPSVFGCLLALETTYYNNGMWFCYSADVAEDDLFAPLRVPDMLETGELWLLRKQRFVYAKNVQGWLHRKSKYVSIPKARFYRKTDTTNVPEPSQQPLSSLQRRQRFNGATHLVGTNGQNQFDRVYPNR